MMAIHRSELVRGQRGAVNLRHDIVFNRSPVCRPTGNRAPETGPALGRLLDVLVDFRPVRLARV